MKRFKIADLERFSAIKAHTFRTWELRYQFAIPNRSASGSRYYTLDDIESLLTASLLNKAGCKISTLVQMTEEEKSKALSSPMAEEVVKQKSIYKLITAMYKGDIEEFEFLLDNCVSYWQIDTVVTDIILPFLHRVSLLCYNDTSAESHFVVTAIRSKIILAIETQKTAQQSGKKAMLFLPKGEHYDLMLLYTNFLVRRQGIRTFYLGTNLSLQDLTPTLLAKKPDYLITYLHPKQKFDFTKLGALLKTYLPDTIIYCVVCERHSLKKKLPAGFRQIHYSEMVEWVPAENINITDTAIAV